jgi:hypothetical protein
MDTNNKTQEFADNTTTLQAFLDDGGEGWDVLLVKDAALDLAKELGTQEEAEAAHHLYLAAGYAVVDRVQDVLDHVANALEQILG